PLGDKEVLAITGAPSLFGEAGFTTLERAWARPTAEVNGIGGGFQGVGTKTVLPREAFAKLTFRLVRDQTTHEILEKASSHIHKPCPPGVKLEVNLGHGGLPYLTDPHS